MIDVAAYPPDVVAAYERERAGDRDVRIAKNRRMDVGHEPVAGIQKAADLNGFGLSREAYRNLKKSVGTEAADMVNACRQQVGQVLVAQQHLARECKALQAELELLKSSHSERLDGVGAWCQQNENALADLAAARLLDVEQINRKLDEVDVGFDVHEQQLGIIKQEQAATYSRTYRPPTIAARLRLVWAWLFGRAPFLEACHVEQVRAFNAKNPGNPGERPRV